MYPSCYLVVTEWSSPWKSLRKNARRSLWKCNSVGRAGPGSGWQVTSLDRQYLKEYTHSLFSILSRVLVNYIMRLLLMDKTQKYDIICGNNFYLMAVSRKGHRPVLHRGHCNTCVKYFFTVLGATQGGLVTSRLYMTCWKFLRNTDVAFPWDVKSRQQLRFECFLYLDVQ